MTSCRYVPFVLSFVALGSALDGGVAHAGKPGTIIVTDHKIEAGSDNSQFEKDLNAAAAKAPLAKNGDNWHIYFVAYLSRAPGAEEINVVFYEPGGHDPINAYPLHTAKTAKILTYDVEIKPEDGFKPNHKYNMRITRLIGGREEIYARTNIDLK